MDENAVILDIGSALIKAGRQCETMPSVVMPTVVGSAPKKLSVLKKKAADDDIMGGKNFLVGDEAISNIGKVVAEYPIEHGVVKNLPQVEALLTQIIEDLDADISNDGVVITQPCFHPPASTEGLAQMMFETFDASELAVANQAACALYASGRTTGLVLDSGEGITQVLPVYKDFIIDKAANRVNFGGKDVTEHLTRILFERGYNFTGPADRFVVQKLKEENAQVAEDYGAEMAKPDGEGEEELEPFFLPDGQKINVGKERFRGPEILFNPALIHSEIPGMAQLVAEAIKHSAIGVDARPDLLGNIVLSGGNTLYPGFAERLKDGVQQYFPGFAGVRVIEGADRKYGVWAGAQVLAGLDTFRSSVIPRDAYEEHGPSVIHGFKRDPEPEE